MLFVCRPKVLHKHCLQFLLGVKMAPREIENNTYVKFWGDKQRALWYVMIFLGCGQHLRACLHGGGGPQVGEVTCLGEVKKKITLLYKQSYNPAIQGCTFSRLLNGC